MKVWKKTMAMVLALGFAFSAAACGDEDVSSSPATDPSTSISAPNGDTSTGGDDSSDSSGGTESGGAVVETVQTKFMNAIKKSVSEAKTYKASIEFNVKDLKNKGSIQQDDVIINETMDVEFAKTTDGVDLHADLHLEQNEKTMADVDIYLVNGYGYLSLDGKNYYKTKKDIASGLEVLMKASFNALPEEVADKLPQLTEIAAELLEKLQNCDLDLPTWDDVEAELVKQFTVDGNVMKYSVQAPAAIEAALDALIEYDYKQTLESAIDGALVTVIPVGEDETQLTMDGILDVVAKSGSYTAEDLWDYVDAWLEETYEVGIQEVYNGVVTDTTVGKIFALAGMSQDFVTGLQDMTNLHELFFGEEGTFKDFSVDAVWGKLTEETEGAPQNVEELASAIRDYCSSTKVEDSYLFAGMQEAMQALKDTYKFNKLGMEVGAEFTGEGDTLALKKAYYTFDFDMDVKSWTDGVVTDVVSSSVVAVKISLDSFNDATIAVALPADIKVQEVWLCENGCGEFLEKEADYHERNGALLCAQCYAVATCDTDWGTLGDDGISKNVTISKDGVKAFKFTLTEATDVYVEVNAWAYLDIRNATGSWGAMTRSLESERSFIHVEALQPGEYYVTIANETGADIASLAVSLQQWHACAAGDCYTAAANRVEGNFY